ncbi:MAG TPA: transglycosylase domain-containing protein [Candidatus Dormibacteraeota bacterium]|nr:transglycosylase domain-containing protein [Candidatus Dormibacteraeota bacterium]
MSKLRSSRHTGRLLRVLLLAVIATPTLILSSPTYAGYASTFPDISQLTDPIATDTIIYASDGTSVLADLHPAGYQHYSEPLSAMGTSLPAAIIAIEDHNFYSEPGVDPFGVVRAALVDWKASSNVEGASTITQQLVKLRLVGDKPTLDRKLREALLSFEVERTYSKSQILEMYLNNISFGNSAVGTAAASEIYFHKKTSALDLAQASLLAGLVRGPSYYSPLRDWKNAKARQGQVLDAMVRNRTATRADADAAFAEDLTPPNHLFLPVNQIVAAGFVSYVTAALIQQFGAAMTYGGGLHVISTLDLRLQNIGQRAISGTVHNLAWRRVQQGALVAIDPASGAIIAMVSSANPAANGGQYNLAVWPPRNPGSSMKIFTYTTAIASGKYTMTTLITDSPISIPDGSGWWRPQNYDGRYHGTLQLQQAMGNSLNIPAVKVELGVGTQNVVAMARAMGAPPWVLHADGTETDNGPAGSYGPSLTLGGYGETPLQMATGASVLAAGGVLHQPFAITRVELAGKAIYTHQTVSTRVIDPKVAYIMAAIMSNDANHALIFGRNTILNIRGYHVAVKTGTSDSFADAWTLGFTPHIAVAVWMGNPDWRTKMTQGSDSFYVAVPAWHAFLASALPLFGRDAWYSAPAGLIRIGSYYYLPGTAPRSWSTTPSRKNKA